MRLESVIPERALGANPESISFALRLDSGFARKCARPGMTGTYPALSRTPARKNFCGSTASPSIRVS
jgi:hypothetical protein